MANDVYTSRYSYIAFTAKRIVKSKRLIAWLWIGNKAKNTTKWSKTSYWQLNRPQAAQDRQFWTNRTFQELHGCEEKRHVINPKWWQLTTQMRKLLLWTASGRKKRRKNVE